MCGYLEEYIDATAKLHKSQAKDYEKVLKVFLPPSSLAYVYVLTCLIVWLLPSHHGKGVMSAVLATLIEE